MMTYIRTLTSAELPAYRSLLLRLSPEDRRLRFGYPARDEAICSLVGRHAAAGNCILAVFNQDLEMVASVHLSYRDRRAVEFAFTVDRAWRGKGLGRALFDRAILWARNHGFQRAHLFYATENQIMRRMARGQGMAMTIDGGDCEGVLALPRATPLTLLREFVLEQLASFDYLLWAHRRFSLRFLQPRTA